MSEHVHTVTDLPKKHSVTRQRVGKVAFYGIYAAGCILLIDDAVRKVSSWKKSKANDTTDN